MNIYIRCKECAYPVSSNLSIETISEDVEHFRKGNGAICLECEGEEFELVIENTMLLKKEA